MWKWREILRLRFATRRMTGGGSFAVGKMTGISLRAAQCPSVIAPYGMARCESLSVIEWLWLV